MSDLVLADDGRARVVEGPGDDDPLVVVLPPISGLTPYIDGVQQRLSGLGFASVAIDYWARAGGVPTLDSPAAIGAAVGQVADEVAVADAADAARLLDRPARAVLGFCIGGSLALLAAAADDGWAAAVSYYGLVRYQATSETKPRSPIEVAGDVAVPYLGHWGDRDHLVPVDHVRDLAEQMAGRPAEVYSYPGAGHAFDEPRAPVYRPVASRDAWRRTADLLGWALRPS